MYPVNIGFHIIDVIIRVIIRDKLLLRDERVIIVIIMSYFDGDLDIVTVGYLLMRKVPVVNHSMWKIWYGHLMAVLFWC